MRVWKPVSILGTQDQHQRSSAFSSSVESQSPPRCYNCNFCEREFKSAQALGGHMNVHRRDRALLRLSSHSNSTSTFHSPDNTPPLITSWRPDDNSPLCEGFVSLPQQPPQWALPTSSPGKRSSTPSPFFHFFHTSSSSLGSHGHSDVAYSDPLEFDNSIEEPSPVPLSMIRCQDAANLEIRVDWASVHGYNVIPNNVCVDLELRLGYTSSSRPSL